MEVWKIIFLSKLVICRFHVDLPGCIWWIHWIDLWNNKLEAMVLRPWFAGLVHLGCFCACRLGSRICAWGCHIARCAERHFPTLSRYFEAMREAICIHIGQGGAMFSSFMFDLPYIYTHVCIYLYIYIVCMCVYIYIWIIIYICIWINPSPCRFQWHDSWQCLKHFASSFWILMRTFGRLWLEDKQPLALAGSTGSVLILKMGYWCLAKSYSYNICVSYILW